MMRYPVLCEGKVVCSFRDQGSQSKVVYLLNEMYTKTYAEGQELGEQIGRECGYEDGYADGYVDGADD